MNIFGKNIRGVRDLLSHGYLLEETDLYIEAPIDEIIDSQYGGILYESDDVQILSNIHLDDITVSTINAIYRVIVKESVQEDTTFFTYTECIENYLKTVVECPYLLAFIKNRLEAPIKLCISNTENNIDLLTKEVGLSSLVSIVISGKSDGR